MNKKKEEKYKFIDIEKNIENYWDKEKVYNYNYKANSKTYSIDTPPPTVSGSLHIGHIFSYTQADIIARYKRLSGYNVFYPFGFDDNGLATERFIEKKFKIKAQDLSRSDFIKLCLDETLKVEKDFEKLWKRIGLSIDWSLNYSTIDYNSRKISQKSFIELYKKNYIYRKSEPALYCTLCKTTVAQAELDDQEKETTYNDIIFKLKDDNKDLIISTTRPELLASVVAILYNKNDERYKYLENKKAIVPIYNHEVDIFSDEDVVIDKGTGLVMVSTFGDKQDIIWAKKYNLNYIKSIDFDGKLTEITGPLKNLSVKEGRKKIIEILKDNNLIVGQKETLHNVNVHERCKTEIEYLVLKQWFLKIIEFKKDFIKLADKINWYPKFMKSRYINWVENISWDWCLSRQRFYGIPFPVWHCLDCSELLIADEKDLPIDPQEVNPKKSCKNCNSNNIKADTDVMDTWNTSSLTPFILKYIYNQDFENIFDNNNFIPLSMRPQAHDIIRTWAFYTIVKSFMHLNNTEDNIPWKDIVISGHVLTTDNQKISKSKENSPFEPNNLIENYPADAIRYWTASGNLGHDVAFSESQILIGQKLLIKLLNAFKFIELNLKKHEYNFNNLKISDFLNISVENEWIIDSLRKARENYNFYFNNYEFKAALESIEKFFWNNFCDNYLEIIKDQLFNSQNYSEEKIKATLTTLYKVGFNILQLYSPFVPYITESIYNLIYKKDINLSSIHKTNFLDYELNYYFENSSKIMSYILEIINQTRKLKTENNLSLKTEIDKLNIILKEDLKDILKQEDLLIKSVTKSKDINYFTDMDLKNSLEIENNIIKNLFINI